MHFVLAVNIELLHRVLIKFVNLLILNITSGKPHLNIFDQILAFFGSDKYFSNSGLARPTVDANWACVLFRGVSWY